MSETQASGYLAASRRMSFSAVDDEGRPFTRVFDVAVHEGQILFHGAMRGEKLGLLGREVVVERHEVVAEIPSYFTDAQRACPATTFYRSVQVRGRVQVVESVETKARLLQRLMDQRQDPGTYRKIDPADPDFESLYGKTLRKLLVARVVPGHTIGRHNLGQHKSVAVITQILAGLWARGAPGDLDAIAAIQAEHPNGPIAFQPGLLPVVPTGHKGASGKLHLRVRINSQLAQSAAGLLEGAFWRADVSLARLAEVQLAASAWVGFETASGELVASARAVSDGCDYAYVGDVIVAPQWRGRGVGKALMRALLEHPRVRHALHVFLVTDGAQELYRGMQFTEVGNLASRVLMRRRRRQPAAPA